MSAIVVHPSTVAETRPGGLPSNPFVGLRPFEAEDSLLFFGRREQSSELLRRLHDTRFLAVVGSSGCGKSSLVRAGLIPVLQAGFLVEDRDVWHINKMKPGDAPLVSLVLALETGTASADRVDEKVRAIREGGVKSVLAELARRLSGQDSNLLLLVDQFEEIFRFDRTGGGSEEAADFVSIMLELAEQQELPVYVVMTMRSDFLGDCDTFCGLPEALNRSQYLVPRLRREQRREAIEGPVRLYRQEIASRLTDRLLNETIDTRDDLPVLQHALMRTWDRWQLDDGGPIDFPHYEAIGTIHSALSKDAEAALQGMNERQLLLTKRLFQALTTVDSGNRGIRRPAKLGNIAARCATGPEEIWPIVDRFRSDGRSFLVVSSEEVGADPLIDISHESLIRQWDTLRGWVEEEAESVKTYRRLAESERLYRKRRAGLYRDQELQVALEWQTRESPNPAWARDIPENFEAAMAFLAAGKKLRDREWAEAVFERRWRYLHAVIIGIVAFVYFFNLGWEQAGVHWEETPAFFQKVLGRFMQDDTDQLNLEAEQVGKLAKAMADMFQITVHLGLFVWLSFVAKQAYRKWAFASVIDSVSRTTIDTTAAVQPKLMVKIMQKLRKTLSRIIERIAKWVCILAGISILGSCTASGLSSGGESGFLYFSIGLLMAAFLVGWVFAVARLNSEVDEIRTRLEQNKEQQE